MNKSISYSEARANFAKIWDDIINDREILLLTRRGQEDLAVLPADELSSLLEALHLMRSPANAKRLQSTLKKVYKNEVTATSLNDLYDDLQKADKS